MKDSGKIIKCTEKAHSDGLMVEFTSESIMRIKNTVSEGYNGQMERSMRAIGEKESKMVKEK